ncbi:MAG: GntR family transcriptional regulator [Nocardioides sp.]
MSADGDQPAFPTLSLTLSSTVDRVAEELRRAVFEGELESGTPLREVALADSLGVARSTVREALGVLVAEGIATREPNRGVWVTSPTPSPSPT